METTLHIGTTLAASALNPSISPTAVPLLDLDRSRPLSALLDRYWGQSQPSPTIVSTSASSTYPDTVDVNRPTTEREELIGVLREWRLMTENWDGEGATAPNLASIEEAVSFTNALLPDCLLPEPLLHASGRAGLYWNEADLYADLEFTGDGRITYYIEHRGKGKHKGGMTYDRAEMPAVLATLLKA